MTKLSPREASIARQFAVLAGNDFVQIAADATLGDVLNILPTRSEPTQDIASKYRDKLRAKATLEGYHSVEEMLAAKSPKPEKPAPKGAGNGEKPKDNKRALPSYVKKLSDLVNMELLSKESPEAITKIWGEYHAQKELLSAVIPLHTFEAMMDRAKSNPVFVLPLPRESGFEMYYLQFSGDQIYYTSLSELQSRKESAVPHFVVTHYRDFEDKKVVLMRGELGLESAKGSLSLSQAQNLVYQTQLFYLTGPGHVKGLVDSFTKHPDTFDVDDLIKAVSVLH